MSLQTYRRKRDFTKTTEPAASSRKAGRERRFVIQKHDASRLHYDLRLELDGTLKSWAVPKGMPLKKGEKHLAVHVEDHPLDYGGFEGTIPKGQYGGGTVMLWDRGSFEPSSKAPLKDLATGKLHFTLHGSKLEGEWHLVRLRDDDNWLVIKSKENGRSVSKTADDTSVLTGRSMKQIAQGTPAKNGNGGVAKKRKPAGPASVKKQRGKGLKFREPMMAKLVDDPPKGEWLYEIKFDGWRALAIKNGSRVELWSRNEKNFSAKFPEIVESFAEFPAETAVIDGEIVALDKKGRSSFQLLQGHDTGEERPPIFFYAFDVLSLNGEDLADQMLTERREALEKLLPDPVGVIRYSASLAGKPATLLKRVSKLGLEGLIGKKPESVYETGRRSGSWIKLKVNQEQEFVIGGYTDPEGARQFLGGLIIGYNEGGKLMYASKVGTGFTHGTLKSLHQSFQRIRAPECPFANLPAQRHGKWGQGITAADMRRCHWVKPVMVCQVKFAEWTRDGGVRQPVFLGLRKDKDAREVTRERPS